MNIILAGDSWGVPNYHGKPGVPPEYHLQYLLQDAGHYVLNVSKNACGNFEAFDWIHKLHTGEKFDYLVWFHTSPYRDHLPTRKQPNFRKYVPYEYYAKINLLIEEVVSKYGVKFIAIGGCTALPKHISKDNLHYFIKDWKSEIIGKQLPEAPWWGCMQYKIDDINEARDADFMVDIISNSDDFPDNGHPGIRPHAELFERLTKEVFEKNDK